MPLVHTLRWTNGVLEVIGRIDRQASMRRGGGGGLSYHKAAVVIGFVIQASPMWWHRPHMADVRDDVSKN